MRPHRRKPIRLLCPWDSPGKNTGVGCHCLLHCMKVKSESEVAQSCPTLSDPMDCSLRGSSVHGISQARVLEWGAIATLVITAKTWKQPICPSIGIWINKLWCIQTMECYSAAAAAKSLQSCLTLCDPIDGSPPDSSVHGIFQARILQWVAISFSRVTNLFILILNSIFKLLLL